MKGTYKITMGDGSVWSIPIMVIAENRADNYKHEFDGSLEDSLAKDTIPLFTQDDYEIQDWARNNMNWCDVKKHAIQTYHVDCDYQDGWINGDVNIAIEEP